jgi:hypothetical protein
MKLHRDLDTDFKKIGDCIARPQGWRRVLTDLVCRAIGHTLWRTGSFLRQPGDSLDVYTCHCRRCFVWGYVENDHRKMEKL